MPALNLIHDEDPAHKIFREAGDLDEVEIFNHRVLVGVYTRPDGAKTKGGVIITHKTTDDDQFQSKMGIILKIGPNAFKDEKGFWFKEKTFSVGDWIVFKANDGLAMKLLSVDPAGVKLEQLCRLMDDTSILMRIDAVNPSDRIY